MEWQSEDNYRNKTLRKVQSALNVDSKEKRHQESFSLKNSGDFFRKIVITEGSAKPWADEDGITYMGVIPFLLESRI